MSSSHIHDYLTRNARERGSQAAIIGDDRTSTWASLDQEVSVVANHLVGRLGSDSQKVVALLLPNNHDFVVTYLAVLRAGHIAAPLDPALKQMEMEAIIQQLEPALVVTDSAHLGEVPGVGAVLAPDLAVSGAAEGPGPAAAPAGVQLPADKQVATLLFTSGTTGKPKLVPYTHANHMWNIEAVSDLWQWQSGDTILLSLPLSHWHGLVMGLAGALYHGNSVYLDERFDAEATLQRLASGDISLFMHVPAAYLKLVNHNPEGAYDLSPVRLFISGSSFLPPAVWEAFERRFGQEILERYGASETGLVASNRLDERKPGSVGYLLQDVKVLPRPDGELGLKSPGIFPGYHDNEAATTAKYVDGWWLTGDIGQFDGDRLRLRGRIQEKMKKLSYTIYPRDVEWALLKLNGVREVVVMGLQDETALHDKLVYFVTGTATEAEIVAFCKANMPAAWRPDQVVLLDEIPKTRSGKPVLRALRQMVQPDSGDAASTAQDTNTGAASESASK